MKKNLVIFGVLLILILLNLVFWQIDVESNNKNLKISFLNVGQGDAIFIQAPNGNQVLIDGGVNSSVVRELSKMMPFYDRTIDLLIGTHADFDHMGGLIDVFDRYQVARFGHSGKGDNGDESDSEFYKIVFEKAEAEILEEIILTRGEKIIIDNDNQVELLVLWPDKNFISNDNNENSIVIRLKYKNFEVMLTGDLGSENENILVEFGDELNSEILKAGHHGSKTSTSKNFLEKVNPEIVIISAEEDSRYGHPHKEVVNRIENFGSKILETKNDTINLISDGESFWQKEKPSAVNFLDGFDFYFSTPDFFKVL